MAKRILEYIKYTADELEAYKNTSGSCVQKVKTIFHINVPACDLKDLKTGVLNILTKKKVGSYNENVDGIILGIYKVKILNKSAAIRFDDSKIHLDVRCDCYFFKPLVGSIVRGLVQHVSASQIGVIIYRVFSVSIRLLNRSNMNIEVGSEIEFRIKKCHIENICPYIEGELVETSNESSTLNNIKIKTEDCTFNEDNETGTECVEKLITEIKEEEFSEFKTPEQQITPEKRKKKKKVSI